MFGWMKSHEIPWYFHDISMKSYQIPWVSTFSTNLNIFLLAQKKKHRRGKKRPLPPWPPWPHRPRPPKSDHPPPWRARRSFPSWVWENGEEMVSKHWNLWKMSMKCPDIIRYLLIYLRYWTCLGRFVRWIRRSCNDVRVLDVDNWGWFWGWLDIWISERLGDLNQQKGALCGMGRGESSRGGCQDKIESDSHWIWLVVFNPMGTPRASMLIRCSIINH